MRFREEPDIGTLGEVEQDAVLRSDARVRRQNPTRCLELAAIKLGRYFSPWPNAEEVRSPRLAVLSAVIVIPVYC